jgi:hypothetical protein
VIVLSLRKLDQNLAHHVRNALLEILPAIDDNLGWNADRSTNKTLFTHKGKEQFRLEIGV